MDVTDNSTRKQTQYWQLAPGWGPVPAGPRHHVAPSAGYDVVVASPEGSITVLDGSFRTAGRLVRHRALPGHRRPQLVIKGGRSMTTTFVMGRKGTKLAEPVSIDRKASAARTRSVDLMWTAPRRHPGIKGYRIQSAARGGGWETVVVDTGKSSATSRTITGLSEMDGRKFRVAVLTKRGMGEYGEPTKIPAADGPPADMLVTGVVGARPQFVKLAPVAEALAEAGINHRIIHTGQHYDERMSQAFFTDLVIPAPDHNLAVGSGGHGAQTGEMMIRLEPVLEQDRPDWVLTYGDTNSTLAAAVVAVKLHLPWRISRPVSFVQPAHARGT